MRSEIEFIESGRDALKWALGCVSASYMQRIVSLNVVSILAIRWALALFIASWAVNDIFAARFVYIKAVGLLGYNSPGNDAASFISALSIVPSWSIVLDSLAGIFYVVAAYWLMRKKAVSIRVLVTGTAINAVACTSQLLTVFNESTLAPSIEDLRRTCCTYALQVVIIVLVWHGFSSDRRASGYGEP